MFKLYDHFSVLYVLVLYVPAEPTSCLAFISASVYLEHVEWTASCNLGMQRSCNVFFCDKAKQIFFGIASCMFFKCVHLKIVLVFGICRCLLSKQS